MTFPTIVKWPRHWVQCVRCGEYVDAEAAVCVSVLTDDRGWFDTVAHDDREACSRALA